MSARTSCLLIAAVGLASCRAPAPGVSPPTPTPPRTARRTADAVALPRPRTVAHERRAVVTAPHGAPITTLAATPEGDAVLSVDVLGQARLWPTLDGTQEPRAVELPATVELALVRDDAGFAAVSRDQAGGLYIARLDREGRMLSHVSYGIDPPFAGIAASARGLLAWRADHQVLLIDASGAATAQLATEPHQRIVSIATAGDRAIALLDRDGTHQVRWLTLTPRLAWGAWIPPIAKVKLGTVIALAPDHKHVAVTLAGADGHVGVIDVATAALSTQRELDGTAEELVFADDKLLAIGGSAGLTWMLATTAGAAAPQGSVTREASARRQLAGGGGRAIWGSGGELALVTPLSTQYLGYATPGPGAVGAAPDGGMLVAAQTRVYQLDAALRTTRSPTLAPLAQIDQVRWLGGTRWLVEGREPFVVQRRLSIVDLGTSETVVREGLAESHLLAYEPSTSLATLSFGSRPEVARVDLAAGALVQLVAVTRASSFEEVVFVPVAPALARGTQLIEVRLRDRQTVRWHSDARRLDRPTSSVSFEGSYAATDAAGRVYAWRVKPDRALELVMFVDGREVGTLRASGPGTLWPDPAASRVLHVGPDEIALHRTDGVRVWTRELAGMQQPVWLSDGGLALTHATGVVRVDPATGDVLGARCGWGFGLSPGPHPVAPNVEPICTQVPR